VISVCRAAGWIGWFDPVEGYSPKPNPSAHWTRCREIRHPGDELGARGYLDKNGPDEEILTAVKTVLAGGKYVTAELAESLVAKLTAENGGKSHHYCPTGNIKSCSHWLPARAAKKFPVSCL